ncbi:hypothetical protein PG997_002876 [Apiospora hydei]|uniref:Aminoglycoside phosphotransferase domain-containing protein n=1 Tax=Apiospora hydei TaxID=1337664 RepID=A0ABR1WXQ2_9PEZI
MLPGIDAQGRCPLHHRPIPQEPVDHDGGQNCHANIKFQDGVEWLARFRLQRNSSPPLEVRDYILRSEAATMFYLQKQTRLPTPKIFDWACEADPENRVRAGYILMEKIDATPLDWQAATDEQRETIMQQLADIFIEIEKHPFASMGSLAISNGSIVDIQGLALPSVFRPGTGPLGPFTSSLEWSRALIESYLGMMADGEIDANLRTEVYLYHRFRREAVGRLWEDALPGHQFFLKHPDDKGDHILINDRYQIVALIDWEWTHTVSAAEAFSSPCMMWPVGNFYEGLNDLAPEERRLAAILREKGREDLASHVVNGRKFQRFFFAIGPESSFLTPKEVADLFVGLQLALDWENVGREHWKQRALETWDKDELLLKITDLGGE